MTRRNGTIGWWAAMMLGAVPWSGVACLAAPAATSDVSPKQPTAEVKQALERTRRQRNSGLYEEAEKSYRHLLKDESVRISAAVGLAETLTMTGECSRAAETLRTVAPHAGGRVDWHLASADVLRRLGDYEAALQHARRALETRTHYAPALLTAGQLLETLGRTDEARQVYQRMGKTVETGHYRSDARSLVALGQILDRYAVLTGRKASDQARNILHNYFQEAYQKVDETYWPAHVAAGNFLLSKHKPSQARVEFNLARKTNPNAPGALAGLGAVELNRWQFEKALAWADRALKINPHHDEALYLKAACFMQWRKFDRVPPILQDILGINPNHIEALSLLAAAHIRMDQPDKARAYIERVRAINPRCAILPHTIGLWLESGRQFEQAEKYFLEAIELSPTLAGPLASLGKMYMQTGEEQRAIEILQRARKLDDFRADIAHYLNVARRLQDFAVKETEHFIIKVDPSYDKVLLDLAAEYMESIYPEVTADYGHEPSVKTIIEILPFQKEFSERISGRAWLPTVGACTGRVIALAAPNKARGKLGLHNWAQVLRHEFAHTVTLEVTGNRIPHWFTEACAVWQQQDKRAFKYIRALVAATRTGRLLSVEDLDWGFIRPKRRGDRMLAYAQSEWMLDYIIRSRGFDRIGKMLGAFGEGKDQPTVFREVLGVTEKAFDKEFRAWAKREIQVWGYDPDPLPTVKAAAPAAKHRPNDPEAQAKYALALFLAGKQHLGAAERSARRALKFNAEHVLALRVLANVHLQRKNYVEALASAARLESIDPTNKTAPRVLAECFLARREWAKAIGALELLKSRHPMHSYSYEKLADLYIQIGMPDLALPNLVYLHKHTMDDPQYARRIAEIYRAMGKRDQALEWFRQVMYINPYEVSAHRGVAAIYLRSKRFDRALEAARGLVELAPKDAETWTFLGTIRYRVGKADRDVAQLRAAKDAAEKARQLDPAGKAEQLMQYIDAALDSLDNPSS